MWDVTIKTKRHWWSFTRTVRVPLGNARIGAVDMADALTAVYDHAYPNYWGLWFEAKHRIDGSVVIGTSDGAPDEISASASRAVSHISKYV